MRYGEIARKIRQETKTLSDTTSRLNALADELERMTYHKGKGRGRDQRLLKRTCRGVDGELGTSAKCKVPNVRHTLFGPEGIFRYYSDANPQGLY